MKTRPMLLTATMLAAPFLTAGLAHAQVVNGPYVSLGAGLNWATPTDVNSFNVNGTPIGLGKLRERFDMGYRTSISAGYGFGNGLRLELEGTYMQNGVSRLGTFASGGGIAGSNFQPSPVTVTGDRDKLGFFVNGIYDLDMHLVGVDTPLTPYIGLGAGYLQAINQGVGYAQGTQAYIRSTGTDGNFAYQAIIGAAYPIAAVPGLSATIDYRFTGMLDPQNYKGQFFAGNYTGPIKIRESQAYNNTLMFGLRYAFNAAPPPPPMAAPAPAPQVAAARTYLVFFDWDKYNLTDRARQIIAEAAQATTRVQVTRIEVSGHTDTTGSAQYNQGLSLRRADAVANELVRLGVPRNAITTQGFGFSRPLVATGPNVREPQNRRVEIVLK